MLTLNSRSKKTLKIKSLTTYSLLLIYKEIIYFASTKSKNLFSIRYMVIGSDAPICPDRIGCSDRSAFFLCASCSDRIGKNESQNTEQQTEHFILR